MFTRKKLNNMYLKNKKLFDLTKILVTNIKKNKKSSYSSTFGGISRMCT
jgi:uncharacterized protein YjfI (DUF2170 family)